MSDLPAGDGRRSKAVLLLAGFGAAGIAVFILVFIASLHRSPGLGGLLSGVFLGLFAALLVAVVGAWMAMALVTPKAAAPAAPANMAQIENSLAPVLTELETTRVDMVRQVKAREVSRIPLGAGAGLAFWIFTQFGKDPSGIFDLFLYAGAGGFGGYVWASHKLSERYRHLYKERVMPLLAAQFGALSYRPAIMPDMGALHDEHIFRHYDNVIAEDELFGTYRGLAISIVELRLTEESGKNRRTVFDGLLTRIDLPRHLVGTIAVISDDGVFGNLRDRLQAHGRERIRLEDPRFEQIYEVYGTDQIAARALLTPAFMERFLALDALSGFERPLALAQDNRLLIALPKGGGGRLFEPPSYREPAANRDALAKLYHDIRTVLDTADAVIGLDQAARTVASPPSP